MHIAPVRKGSDVSRAVPARGGGVRNRQHWAPSVAVAWSLVYAALAIYWAVSGQGFPFPPETVSDASGPLLGRFGMSVALAAASLGYYYRRRGLCRACGRGVSSMVEERSTSYQRQQPMKI